LPQRVRASDLGRILLPRHDHGGRDADGVRELIAAHAQPQPARSQLLSADRLQHAQKRSTMRAMADETLERNKRNAMAFYDLMFNQGQPEEAIARYAGDTYIQHNPDVKDGKEGFIEYFLRMNRDSPGKRVHFVRAIAEDNYVVLHCRQEWPGDRDWAGIDIFRLDANGKVVEHWDVLQRVPEDSWNENGMF